MIVPFMGESFARAENPLSGSEGQGTISPSLPIAKAARPFGSSIMILFCSSDIAAK
jgi:hypothetical protein